MKFINQTSNTVYLSDIDMHIPYQSGNPQTIETDNVLKSQDFQSMIEAGAFKIVEIGSSRIEKNLQKKQGERKIKPADTYGEDTKKQIAIKGHFLEGGGYAKVNRNLAAGLSQAGFDVCIDVLGQGHGFDIEPSAANLNRFKKKAGRNAIRIDSVVPTFGQESFGKYKILYTTIESYTVPKQFIESAKTYNEVWVTSDFCKEVLDKYNIGRPISVVPDSINTDFYKPEGDKFRFDPPLKPFVFISVFNWSYRKGYDVLLKSYLQEFSSKDPVTLLIVSRLNNKAKEAKQIKDIISKYIKEYSPNNAPHISRCSQFIPEANMPGLYRSCDAFVMPTRGEGFGLPICEASLCGLPVIATDASAQQMYLREDNSYLIPVDRISKMPEGRMHIHYWDNQEFAELLSPETIEITRQLMREVYENYDEAKDRNKKLREYIIENYSISSIVNKVKERLEEIEIC